MTKTSELKYGMARKWDRHFVGRWRILGQALVVVGSVTLLILPCIWSQVMFSTTFNSILNFELVVDQSDAWANDWTYKRFAYSEPDENLQVQKWFFWTINNPVSVIETGQRPQIVEVGPYAAVKTTFKYDVAFSSGDDSRSVRYKEWSYYREVDSPSACKNLFYAMDVATYMSNNPDCGFDGKACHCRNLDEQITIANQVFYKLMHQYTPPKLSSLLVREAFEDIERYLTEDFVFAVKSHMAEDAILSVLDFRKGAQLAEVLRSVHTNLVKMNGTEVVESQLTAHQDDVVLKCPGVGFLYEGSDWEYCPWGVAEFVRQASSALGCNGTASLDVAEARFLLQDASLSTGSSQELATTVSFLNESSGIYLWIAAARHTAQLLSDILIDQSLIDDGSAGERAFDFLTEVVMNVGVPLSSDKQLCYARSKVAGVSKWLFGRWFRSSRLGFRASREWASLETPDNVPCDVGLYDSSGHSFVVPGVPAAWSINLYSCAWPLAPWLDSHGALLEDDGRLVTSVVNQSLVQDLINPEKAVSGLNHVSILLDENRIRYFYAFDYLRRRISGQDFMCQGYQPSLVQGVRDIVLALADAVGEDRTGAAGSTQVHGVSIPLGENAYIEYQGLSIGIGTYLFDNWARDNGWMNTYIASFFNTRLQAAFQFEPDALEVLGYAQFAGSYITRFLFGDGVPSVRNVKRLSYWNIAPEVYQKNNFMDFMGHAIQQGYPFMNMTVLDGKTILRLLSSPDDDGVAFRQHVIAAHNTYHCDAPTFVQYMCDNNPEDYCQTSREQYLDFNARGIGRAACSANDGAYFADSNPFADFSWGSSKSPVNADELNYTTVSREEVERVADAMNQAFYSSPDSCVYIDRLNYYCSNVEDDSSDAVLWIDNCGEYLTQVSDSAFGLYCTLEAVGESYDAHPYPRKRGNVLARMMQVMLEKIVLIEGRLVCTDPNSCDYKTGGAYTTTTARYALFEGYVDSIHMKVLNEEWNRRGIGFQCIETEVVEETDQCGLVFTHDCSEAGFDVVLLEGFNLTLQNSTLDPNDVFLNVPSNGSGAVLMRMDRSEANKWNWYSPTVDLPYGLGTFVNPVFAMYSGAMWENETFQKQRACDHRTMGGGKGRFAGCDIEARTGHLKIEEIEEVTEWYGNKTISPAPLAGPSARFNVSGRQGTQLTPHLWEGFSDYSGLLYQSRIQGLDYEGEKSEEVMDADHLLIFKLRNTGKASLTWPLRTEIDPADQNISLDDTFKIMGHRFKVERSSWDDATLRAAHVYKDHSGETYEIPPGMSTLESLTDYPVMVGGPHHYLNRLYDGTEYVEFSGLQASVETEHVRFDIIFDVDPITGKTFRQAKRFQYSNRWERSFIYSRTLTNCKAPCDDYTFTTRGCVMYMPAVWTDESKVMSPSEVARLKFSLFTIPATASSTTGFSALASLFCIAVGTALWRYYNAKELVFRERIYID